jgi:hypothetical protein
MSAAPIPKRLNQPDGCTPSLRILPVQDWMFNVQIRISEDYPQISGLNFRSLDPWNFSEC